MREPQVRQLVSEWLDTERARLAAAAHELTKFDSDDGSDDDERVSTVIGYCGRPGCRLYPHEHVGSRKPGGEDGDPFAR